MENWLTESQAIARYNELIEQAELRCREPEDERLFATQKQLPMIEYTDNKEINGTLISFAFEELKFKNEYLGGICIAEAVKPISDEDGDVEEYETIGYALEYFWVRPSIAEKSEMIKDFIK